MPVDHIIGKAAVEEITRSPIDGPVKVLLVEDEEADAELTRRALDHASLDVELAVAKNGAEAVQAIRTYGPDSVHLVLLDLKMPVFDGHQFLEQVGEEFDLDDLNIMVLTTSTNETDRERAHALGAGAYLVKDPDFHLFCDTMESVVREVAAG
ncbi:MAG: response regulator [Acidimicrobiia bacterium]|nr:response regulator [Acidimicrobiia bacterium]